MLFPYITDNQAFILTDVLRIPSIGASFDTIEGNADYVVGSSVSRSKLPAHSCVVDSTVSSIQPNVELASNIVTKSSLGDCIFDVGMTVLQVLYVLLLLDTADNSVDVDPGIGSSSSTRESRSSGVSYSYDLRGRKRQAGECLHNPNVHFPLMKDGKDWGLKLGELTTIWKDGYIIRAIFVDRIKHAYDRNPELANLIVDAEKIDGRASYMLSHLLLLSLFAHQKGSR
ncbi:phosphogluconate dehydrogenase [Tanacetum coccineum]